MRVLQLAQPELGRHRHRPRVRPKMHSICFIFLSSAVGGTRPSLHCLAAVVGILKKCHQELCLALNIGYKLGNVCGLKKGIVLLFPIFL